MRPGCSADQGRQPAEEAPVVPRVVAGERVRGLYWQRAAGRGREKGRVCAGMSSEGRPHGESAGPDLGGREGFACHPWRCGLDPVGHRRV